jgi:UDP-glucuronate 4-epimerase
MRAKMLRDFTYIDDIVEGVVRVARRPATPDPEWDAMHPDTASSSAPYRLYNIGNSEPVELSEFVSCLEEALGKKARIEYLPMQPGDVEATAANVDELNRDVGFRPSTPLREGMKKFCGLVSGLLQGLKAQTTRGLTGRTVPFLQPLPESSGGWS